MNDSPNQMIKSAASFFSGTMLSRATGLLRDMVMAFAFGTQASLAAFFVAFRFAHLLRRLLGENTLQSAFIPQFESLRGEDKTSEHAITFFINLYAALSLILLLIIGVGIIASQILLQYCDSLLNPDLKEIFTLAILMLPSLLFICLAGLNNSLLQCERCYFLPAVAPVAFNLIWILGAILLSSYTTQEAMPKLALCIVAACFFQWLMTMPKTISLLIQYGLTVKHLKYINPFSKTIHALWKPFLLGIIGIGAMQINSACDALFARFADNSGPAYLWYAIRLQQLPLALFGIALSGALLPPLARAIKHNEIAQAFLLIETAVQRSMLLILPITCAIFIFGKRSLHLLYGYGDFGPQSLAGTHGCLWGYTIGLIPMSLVLIAAPLFHAKEDYRTPTSASVASMLLNMALNALFVIQFQLSATSIALATSISAWVNLVYLIVAMETSPQTAFLQSILKTLKQIGVPLVLACAVTLPVSSSMPLGDTFFSKCFYLGSLALLFFGLYGIGSFLLLKERLRSFFKPKLDL